MDRRNDAKRKQLLEIVLKCDSVGSIEAVTKAISRISIQPGVGLIRSSVGAVSKSDLLMAETGGRLIVGFQVDVVPGMDKAIREHNVEVRLYSVIYTLTDDLEAIASSLIPAESQDQVIGSAKVIAIFKSTRKGVILGCEILDGFLAVGQRFRIISAMGPVYAGAIESMHIGETAVEKAARGQQAGIKIKNFNKARIGDLVESFRPLPPKIQKWQPSGKIIRK